MPVWWMKGEISLHFFCRYGIFLVDGRIGEIRKPECRWVLGSVYSKTGGIEAKVVVLVIGFIYRIHVG